MKMAAVVGCWQLIVHKLHSGMKITFISLRAKIKTIITEDILYFIINLGRISTSYFTRICKKKVSWCIQA